MSAWNDSNVNSDYDFDERNASILDGTAEDDYYDVLSARELRHHLTEMFLQVKPSMNAEQVLEARERVIEFAQKQGLLDEL